MIDGGTATTRLSSTGLVDDVFTGGGHVGLYRATSGTATTLVWDDFKCGVDQNSDGDVDDSGTDYIWADYNFDSASWKTLTFTHDANGNLSGDGLFKYKYDVWNRLVGVWYDGGDTAVSGQRVARYEYDGLFRRIEKELSNQGDGIVYGSNPSGITGIQGGDRFERYYYAGWRVVELRDNYSSPNRTLGQFVYGTNTSTSRWPTTATPTRRRAARRIMIVWIRAGRSAMCTIRM